MPKTIPASSIASIQETMTTSFLTHIGVEYLGSKSSLALAYTLCSVLGIFSAANVSTHIITDEQ